MDKISKKNMIRKGGLGKSSLMKLLSSSSSEKAISMIRRHRALKELPIDHPTNFSAVYNRKMARKHMFFRRLCLQAALNKKEMVREKPGELSGLNLSDEQAKEII